MSRKNRPTTKDMYWFAHGGIEALPDKYTTQRSVGDGEEENDSNSLTLKTPDRRSVHEDLKTSFTDGSSSSGPPSLERDDKLHAVEKRMAVEERKRQLWEAEQERNEALLRKHMEREAALEARRNAQRSNIAFAFGSSVPRYVEALQVNQNFESENMSRSFTAGGLSHKEENHDYFHDRRSLSPFNYSSHVLLDGLSHRPDSSLSSHSEKKYNSQSCWLTGSGALVGEDLMSKSMTASLSAPRGRRKNDLMPTVPYDRTSTPRVATSSSSRRRSVSMTRLDQLAQPRRHYVEATKANSTASSGTSSMLKDVCSPNRPLSSASEHSGGRVSSNVTRRVRSSPRKPRPVSIAGTIPDQKHATGNKSSEIKVAPIKRNYSAVKKTTENIDIKKTPTSNFKSSSTPKSNEKVKSTERMKSASRTLTPPVKASTPKTTAVKQSLSKGKKSDTKVIDGKANISSSTAPKTQVTKNLTASKKKTDNLSSIPNTNDVKDKSNVEDNRCSPPPDGDAVAVENEKNSKRIISEEEARAALAEKRKLAREQAEREAELERQRQEELRRLEEERIRQEEEEQRKLEEEHLRLLEEHRRQEEEKLRKAIEDQEQREEEERAKRDEEMRLKAEQERKAKEEAEKLRLELEEKLRKEEEERAERKKRLEKIMSRTRGKSSGTSPSGSVSGSDHLDSGENQQESYSSGANSLESNEAVEPSSEPMSSDDAMAKMEVSSGGNSLEANLTYEFGSNDVSLNSNDLMLPISETASQDNSMVVITDRGDSNEKSATGTDSVITPVNIIDELEISNSLSDTDSHIQNENTTVSDEKDIAHSENIISDCLPQENNEKEEIGQFNVKSSNQKENSVIECASIEPSFLQEVPESCFQEKISTNDNSPELSRCEEIISDHGIIDYVPIQPNSDIKSTELEDIKNVITSDFQGSNEENMLSEIMDYSSTEQFKDNVMDDAESEYLDKDVNLHNKIAEVNDVSDNINSEKALISGITQPEKEQQNIDSFEHQEELNFFQNENNFSNSASIIAIENTEVNGCANQEQNLFEKNQNPFSGANQFYSSTNEEFVEELKPKDDIVENLDEENFNQNEEFFEQFCDKTGESNNLKENEILSESQVLTQNIQENNEVEVTEKIVLSDFPHTEYTHSSILTKNGEVEGKIEAPEESKFEVGSTGDNPFVGKPVSELNMFPLEGGDHNLQEPKSIESEQIRDLQNQIVHKSSEFPNEDLNNITLIKEKDSENLIGIISSIDNDQISNNFSMLHEQLTNNFECVSTTESEESSLDSNLSQVIAIEEREKNAQTGLNHAENETNSIHLGNNNLDHSDNPFKTECAVSKSSMPQSAVNLFTSSEVYSNGHSVESSQTVSHDYSEFHDFVQLDGNNILSVDHSKNNMFENVDAIDYGKVSPDSFLAKGSSKQISGNPFLMQDDQKQVLMSSDFLN